MNPGAGLKLAVGNDMTGVPVPSSALSKLTRTDAASKTSIADADIDFTRRSGRPLPAGTNVRWEGTLTVPVSGDYDIDLQILGATGTFGIDGQTIGRMGWWGGHGDVVFPNRDNVIPTTDGLDNLRRLVKLSAGAHTHHRRCESRWERRSRAGAPCLGHARNERARVRGCHRCSARLRRSPSCLRGAEIARPLALPGDQDRLIAEVAAVNPNTIVVLNTGQAVAMPWLKDVRAVLEMWYTGDEGGWAAANLLTGKASPAGRLPFTWPRRLEDMPATDPAHPERSWLVPMAGRSTPKASIIGYRWFDHKQIDPLFPFGFGLSYSRFDYSRLTVRRAADGGLDVSCTIRNSGKHASDEVVQVYLGAPEMPPAGVAFAVRALADFERITLRPGEVKARAAARCARAAALLVHGRFGVAHRDRRTDAIRWRLFAGSATEAPDSRRRWRPRHAVMCG